MLRPTTFRPYGSLACLNVDGGRPQLTWRTTFAILRARVRRRASTPISDGRQPNIRGSSCLAAHSAGGGDMRRKVLLVASAVLLAAVTVSPAQAITYGQPDGELHPNAGALVGTFDGQTYPYCSRSE